jgi:hypothetical protein
MDKNDLSGVLRKARFLLLQIRRSVASGGHIDQVPEFDAWLAWQPTRPHGNYPPWTTGSQSRAMSPTRRTYSASERP